MRNPACHMLCQYRTSRRRPVGRYALCQYRTSRKERGERRQGSRPGPVVGVDSLSSPVELHFLLTCASVSMVTCQHGHVSAWSRVSMA
eukprot:3881606-Rhodomonas_salina.5